MRRIGAYEAKTHLPRLRDELTIRDLLAALPVQVEGAELRTALGEVTEIARSLDLTACDGAYVRRPLAPRASDGRQGHGPLGVLLEDREPLGFPPVLVHLDQLQQVGRDGGSTQLRQRLAGALE